jgi:hypothetical protein
MFSLLTGTCHIRSAYPKTRVHAYEDSQQPQSINTKKPLMVSRPIHTHQSRPLAPVPSKHISANTTPTTTYLLHIHSIPGSAILLDRPTAASNKSHTTNSASDHRCRSKHILSSTWALDEKLVWSFNRLRSVRCGRLVARVLVPRRTGQDQASETDGTWGL